MIDNKVPESVIRAHAFIDEWITDTSKYKPEIKKHLESRTGYDAIIKPTDEEWQLAHTVGTSLAALDNRKMDALIKQAEALTEIQVKLYCPSLI